MPFCELHLQVDSSTTDASLSQLLISAFDLGYDRIVLCQTDHLRASAPGSASGKKKKRKLNETENDETTTASTTTASGSAWVCPKPYVARIPDLIHQKCRRTKRQFRLYSRLNVIIHDNQSLHYLKRAEVQQHFDLISLQASSREIFLYLLGATTVQHELIVLDPSDSDFLPFPSKLMRAAAERGIAFELIYSNALRDTIERRNLLAFGRALSMNIFKHGQALVLASNANGSLQLRSPHDLMEIGQLFGYNEEISRKIVTTNPIDVLSRSFSRRKTVQGAIWSENENEKEEKAVLIEGFQATDKISI